MKGGDELQRDERSDTPLLDVGDALAESEGAALRPEILVLGLGGRRTSFDRERLRQSVDHASRAGGGAAAEPPELDDEIADIVAFTLRARAEVERARPGLVVTSDEVGALVERALIEVGAAATARAYIVKRDRRARAAGEVARATGLASGLASGLAPGAAPEGGTRLPMVRGATGPEPFRAHRIVAALVEETGLLPEQAEEVAERVAETLRGAALPSVSTALVRELVSNELLGLGLGDALRRHEAIGIPRHDLLRLFEGAPGHGVGDAELGGGDAGSGAFAERVAEEIIGRWAVADLVSSEVADAHARGDIGIVGLGAFHAPIARAIPVGLLAEGIPALPRLLERAIELARGTTHGLVLEGLVGHGPAGDPFNALTALGAVALAGGRPIGLARPDLSDGGATARAWLESLDRAGEEGARAPCLYLTWSELATLLAAAAGPNEPEPEHDLGPEFGPTARACGAAERAIARGRLVPVWSGERGRAWAGPGLRRAEGDRGALALDAAVALNLPRLARRAGPWREDAFLERLHAVLVVAVEALSDRARFVERARGTLGAPLAEERAVAVVPVGLHEALRILGDGLARADQGARVLGFLGDALERLFRRGGARGADSGVAHVELTSAFGERAARRFARLDAAQSGGTRQPRLFGDLPRPEEDVARHYSSGFGDLVASADTARVGRRAEALGVLLGTVRAGALYPAPPQRGAPRIEAPRDRRASEGHKIDGIEAPAPLLTHLAKHPRLAAWGRFAAIRSAGVPDQPREVETTLF